MYTSVNVTPLSLSLSQDPFPVGGGRSSFEIFSAGTPIVLHKGRTNILQLTHGMYTMMNITESFCCITRNDDDFVSEVNERSVHF